jgi:hypothetical protein
MGRSIHAKGIEMTSRNIVARIEKLEAKQPPASSPLDGLTCDELTILLLEHSTELIANIDESDDDRSEAERELARLSEGIIETINFATGRWATIPGLNNYQEHLERWRKQWIKVRPDESEFVPALRHDIEGDGFGRPDPVTPDLMARRAKCWGHPIVKQIIKDAPKAHIPPRSLMHECRAFKESGFDPRAENCALQCRRECLNVRRGGFEGYRSNCRHQQGGGAGLH